MRTVSRRERNGYLVYGGWLAAWGALEYLGFKSWTPWPPLSDTSWYLERRGRIGVVSSLVLYGGLAVLQKHIADHWPDRAVSAAWKIDPHGEGYPLPPPSPTHVVVKKGAGAGTTQRRT